MARAAAQQSGAWIAGAVCAESGRLNASATAAARRKPLTPPQRVASACSTSTAPASASRRKYWMSHLYAGCGDPAEILDVVPVLAGGNGHTCRCAVAEQSQPFEIVRRHRLFEP